MSYDMSKHHQNFDQKLKDAYPHLLSESIVPDTKVLPNFNLPERNRNAQRREICFAGLSVLWQSASYQTIQIHYRFRKTYLFVMKTLAAREKIITHGSRSEWRPIQVGAMIMQNRKPATMPRNRNAWAPLAAPSAVPTMVIYKSFRPRV